MDVSIFLGKVLGLYFVVVSGLYLIRKDEIKTVMKQMFQSRALLIYGGILALIIGLLVVVAHPVWVLDWRILVTLTGYLSLIKGISLLYFPEHVEKFSRKVLSNNNYLLTGVITAAIGLLLIYMSFIAH